MEGGAVIETRLGLPDRKQINTGKQLATGSCLDRPVPVPDQSSLGKSSSSPVPSAAVRITGHFGCLIVCVCVLSAVLVAFGFCGFRFFGGAGNQFNDSFVQLKLFAVFQFSGS